MQVFSNVAIGFSDISKIIHFSRKKILNTFVLSGFQYLSNVVPTGLVSKFLTYKTYNINLTETSYGTSKLIRGWFIAIPDSTNKLYQVLEKGSAR